MFELNTRVKHKFTEQMKLIKRDKLKFHQEYDKLIKKK